jgi:hypothetical protein
MKKFLILGAFLFVSTITVAKELQPICGTCECPSGCDGAGGACCKTKNGSTYYGKCNC